MNIKIFRCLESWDRPDFGFPGGVSVCECVGREVNLNYCNYAVADIEIL